MAARQQALVSIGIRFARYYIVTTALSLAWAGVARADSVNSPNITLNVDTNRTGGNGAGNVSLVINTVTIAETMLPEYSSGAGKAISIQARPGFQFDPTSNVTAQSATIGINGGGINAVATVTPTGAADETITFNFTSGTNVNVQDIIRINGIRVRIISAAGAAGPAQTTLQVTTSAAGGAFTNQGIVAANITKGAPNSLVFEAQPGSTQAAGDLLPAVKIVDFGGNLITNDARNITLAIQSNPSAGTLNGNAARDTSNGVATWLDADNLSINTAGNGYTLRASHSGANFLTSDTVDSDPFNIVAGEPDHLVITRQPVTTAAGADILIDVTVQDAFNNTVTLSTENVSIEAASNPGGWPLLTSTSLTKPFALGVASWSAADDLRINKAVVGYRLAASGVGQTVFSDSFDIVPADPAALRFVQQPTTALQNAPIAPPVTVQILDAFDNLTTSTATVNLTLATAPCGGTVTGGSAAAVAGVATFDALSIDTPCEGNALEASSGNLVRTTSDTFAITAIPAPPFALCGIPCGAGIVSVVPMMLIQATIMRRRRARRRS